MVDGDLVVGPDLTLACPANVLLEPHDAVRVVTHEVGRDHVLGDDLGDGRARSHGFQDLARETM
jgi:hypothetical protein